MPTEVDQYFNTVTQGIGEAYGQLYQAIGCLSGGIALCFVKGPIFFLISAMYIPFFLILSMFFGRFPKDAAFLKMQANHKLDSFALEYISAFKLIACFAQEEVIQ